MKENNIIAEHLSFEKSCHSVQDAINTTGANPNEFIKNICMIDYDNNLIIAIVDGHDRASTKRVKKALQLEHNPKIAIPDEILKKTGFPCGGTPSFGCNAIYLIDPKVMEKEKIYSGGGSTKSLVKLTTKEMKKANNGKIVRVKK
ncbi:hypothetical protein HOD20_00185 [archaeon]|nr:hypothetical protein [archaeon]MBT4350919.1 hypothetical protein [archaeon]MBT4646949.1 hypothetical protein [archaeon]MBT6821685.1 hypothetical protein [archaeon]MBT7392216.1 hypothetical protein [archaeon]